MTNIWLLLSISFGAYITLIGVIIYNFIKKGKWYIITNIIAGFMLVFIMVSDLPYYKDLTEKNTTVVVAEYVKFQNTNTLYGTHMLFFTNEHGQEFSLYIPKVTRTVGKMKIGKTYEIQYFNNSKVIKEYILVDDVDQ